MAAVVHLLARELRAAEHQAPTFLRQEQATYA
jgi:hypothetical protein